MSGRKEIARSYYMVARGNNRNNGSNLGAVYLNANNGLSNSNGNNWRSRLSNPTGQFEETHHRRKTGGTIRPAEPETPLIADGARESATAVKDAHKHAVSRAIIGFEGRKG